MTLAGCLDDRQEHVTAVDRPPQVDVERPAPVLERHVTHRPGNADAGVVAQNVHRSELLDGGFGKRLDVGQLRYVSAHSDGFRTGRAHLRSGVVQRGFLDVGQHHIHARCCERIDH